MPYGQVSLAHLTNLDMLNSLTWGSKLNLSMYSVEVRADWLDSVHSAVPGESPDVTFSHTTIYSCKKYKLITQIC